MTSKTSSLPNYFTLLYNIYALGIVSAQRKCSRRECISSSLHLRDDTEQDPAGLLDTKVFLCLLFLVCRKQASFSLHDLSWVPKGRFKQLLIREGRGCGDKAGQVKKQYRRLARQSPCSPSRHIHRKIFKLFCRTKTPTKGKMLTTWWSTPFQREGHNSITSRSTRAHHETSWWQMLSSNAGPARSLILISNSTPWLLKSPPGWDTVLRALGSYGPFGLARQYSCSFLLHPNPVSEIQFGAKGTDADVQYQGQCVESLQSARWELLHHRN